MKNALLSAKRSALKVAGLCLILSALVTCAGPQEDLSLAHPLSRRLTFFKTHETFISAAPGVSLGYLCDLKIFRDLRPGMTAEEVSRLYGPPTSKYQERQGRRTVYVFPTGDGAKIEVVMQMVGSEEPQVELWALRYSVAGKGLEKIVAPEVLAAIPLPQRGFTLHLSSEEAGAMITFDAGRPHRLWWVRDDKSESGLEKTGLAAEPGPTNQRQIE